MITVNAQNIERAGWRLVLKGIFLHSILFYG